MNKKSNKKDAGEKKVNITDSEAMLDLMFPPAMPGDD